MSESTDPHKAMDDDTQVLRTPVPHAGLSGIELPVEEFDTPLVEAHERGLLETPDDVSQLHPATEEPEPPLTPNTKPDTKKKWLIPAAAFGLGIVSIMAIRSATESENTTKSDTGAQTDDQDDLTTTTARILEPENQDFRPKDEQTHEIEYVYAEDDSAESVLGAIYKNLELAHEQRNTSYLTYYLDDRESDYAQTLIKNINDLDNFYPVTIKFEILFEQKIGEEWHIQVSREFDVDTPDVYDGDPETRQLILVQKEVLRQDQETGEYVPSKIWVISEDSIVNN